MRSALVLLAVAGCADAAVLEPDAADLAALAVERDVSRASNRARRIAAAGCGGLTRAIAALERGSIAPRDLIGLVGDAVSSARPRCPDPARALAPHRGPLGPLARVALATPAEARAGLGHGPAHPAVHLRRAELAREVGDRAAARAELGAVLAATDDRGVRATLGELLLEPPADPAAALAALGVDPLSDPVRRPAAVAALAAAGRAAEAAAAIAVAPLPDRPELARRAVAAAPDAGALLAGEPDVELVVAAAARADDGGRALLARASAAAPDRADLADAAARAAIAAGAIDEAIAAWDRAAARAPALASLRRAPIAALVAAGRAPEARARAAREAAAARRSGAPDPLLEASRAARAAVAPALAVELLAEARRLDPASGELRFEHAAALAAAGRASEATAGFAELLICGAHGRPWHRHEVSARLVDAAAGIASADRARALTRPGCPPVDPVDLAGYVAELERRFAAKAAPPTVR